MEERLLPEREQGYNPFANPPDIKEAQTHRKATMVGLIDRTKFPKFCPCCDNVVNKQPLPVCFPDDMLISFGIGYPLYYKISKYFILVLLGIFVVSGSAMVFLMSLRCDSSNSCISLLGIPIINISIMDQPNLNSTSVVNTLTAVGIFAVVLYLKAVANDEISALTNKKNCPSIYTVMLQNVPDIGDQELATWIGLRLGQVPVEINWAYDVQRLAKAIKKKQNAFIQRNCVAIEMRRYLEIDKKYSNSVLGDIKKQDRSYKDMQKKFMELQKQIKQQDEIIDSYNKELQTCEKVGTVFVTFDRVDTVNRIIQSYQSSFFNSLIKDTFSWVKKSRLLLGKQVIMVNKAPAPREVIWQNLSFSYIRSLIFQVAFIAVMAIMLYSALQTILWFMNYSLSFRIEGQQSGQLLIIAKGLVFSLIVVIINCLMRLVIKYFTAFKRYFSYTKYEASFILYYSVFYVLNSCCVVYIVHQSNAKDTQQLLLTDIHLVMLANAFSQPLFKLFDPVMWYRIVRRWYIGRLKPDSNPYTQEYVNKLWEGHQISNADNYQYITRVLFITTWFATVAPLGVFLSLMGLVCDYWISKWLLVRYYKIPENVSEDIAKPTLMGLELLPLVYILGILQFNYKVSSSQTLFQFFFDFLNYGVTTLILLLSITGYILFFNRQVLPSTSRRYERAKIGFRYNYETENPLTKLKGETHYLTEVLKENRSEGSSSRISQLLKMSKEAPQKLSEHRQQLILLKMEMERKVSEAEIDIQMQQIKKDKQNK